MEPLLLWKNFPSLIFSPVHLDASGGRILDMGINQYTNSIFWSQGWAYDPVQANERGLWKNLLGETGLGGMMWVCSCWQ